MGQKTLIFDKKWAIFFNTAKILVDRGWSLIPILGDKNPTTPKAPAIPSWKIFQSRLPTESDLREWFESGRAGAFGLVMGKVSGLVALDIDSPEADELFRRTCPDLTDTMIVQSGNRGLPHYYFHIPAYWGIVSSWSAPGADFRAEGTYMVAPNVTIGDKVWRLINGRMPRTLSEADLSRLDAFSRLLGRKSPVKPVSGDSGAKERYSDRQLTASKITASGLRRRYVQRAGQIGRNNALFETACYARDRGWSIVETSAALIESHVKHPAPPRHPIETPRRREREADATLASVYSRPARNVTNGDISPGLPNRLREAMLQAALDREARVLDALLIAGFRPGEVIRPAQVYAAVGDWGIGRNAVYTALKALLPDGAPLFRAARTPTPPHPPARTAYAAIRCAGLTNPCVIGRGAKPGKNPRGRPEAAYVIPAIAGLCARFEVEGGYSDSLQKDDFASPAAYRAALHRLLIERAPGTYIRHWLAARLGVSVHTVRRYDVRAGVRAAPRYQDWVLSFPAVDHVIPDRRVWGQFLEDDQGRRYPPVAELARKLLKQGKRLWFRVQDANHYRRELSPMVTSEGLRPGRELSPMVTSESLRPGRELSPMVTSESLQPGRELSPMVTSEGLQPGRELSPMVTSESLQPGRELSPMVTFEGDEDAAANTLYDALREANPNRALTRRAAQQLIADYGPQAVEKALRRVLSKTGVRNPAGLLKTLLRDVPKRQRAEKSPAGLPRESHRSWLSKLAASAYSEYVNTGQMTLEEIAAVEF